MKQGTTKKALPKDKHTKASWKKRDDARKVNQQVYAANLLLAARDADEHSAQVEMAADDAAEAGEEARASR